MQLNLEKKALLLILLIVGVITSCDTKRIFEENSAIEKGTWNVNHKVNFEVSVTDIVPRYNVYLNVRNSTEYPYCNLYLFLNTGFPDGKIARDTLELTLADYDGRWFGSGMGSVKFSRFLFQKGVRFKQKGTYRFVLEQAMRVNELKGISDIGLRIEKE